MFGQPITLFISGWSDVILSSGPNLTHLQMLVETCSYMYVNPASARHTFIYGGPKLAHMWQDFAVAQH